MRFRIARYFSIWLAEITSCMQPGWSIESKYGHLPVTHVACIPPWPLSRGSGMKNSNYLPQTAPVCLMGHNPLAAQNKWLGQRVITCSRREKPVWAKSRRNDTLKTESLSNPDEKDSGKCKCKQGDQLHFLPLFQSL